MVECYLVRRKKKSVSGTRIGPLALGIVRAEYVQRRFVEAVKRRRGGENPLQSALHVRHHYFHFLSIPASTLT